MTDWRRSLERLCKWRSLLTGWHLGTRAEDEAGVQAMRDLRELTLIMRVELNAMVALLVAKGVFTKEEFEDSIGLEADQTNEDMEQRFPGYRTSDEGLVVYDAKLAQDTCIRLGFPI